MKITTVGIDLAKNVFQVHGVNEQGKVILKKQIKPPMATSKSPTCGHPNSSRQDEQIIGALRVSCRGDVDGVGPAFFDFPMNGCLASAARQAGGVGRGAVGRQRTP